MTDVTQLTENIAPAFEDLAYTVDDPAGSPLNRKVTLQSVVNLNEINAQTGTSYTLVLGDRAKTITMSNAAANTLTIPLNSAVAFPIGTAVIVRQLGAGVTSVAAATGVTLDGVSAGSADASAQYKAIILTKIGTDAWVCDGSVGAVA